MAISGVGGINSGAGGINPADGRDNPLLTYVNQNPAPPQQGDGAGTKAQTGGWNSQPAGWNNNTGGGQGGTGPGATQGSNPGGQKTAQLAPFTAFFRPGPVVTEGLAPRVPTTPMPQPMPQGAGPLPPAPITGPYPGTNPGEKPDPKQGPDPKPLPPPTATTNKDDKRTCADIGSWQPENQNGWSANAKAYQGFVTGHPGEDFAVPRPDGTSISYDGCQDTPTGPSFQEAKGEHPDGLGQSWFRGTARIQDQGQQQQKTATQLGVPVTWYTQTAEDKGKIDKLFETAHPPVNIPVVHLPMPTYQEF